MPSCKKDGDKDGALVFFMIVEFAGTSTGLLGNATANGADWRASRERRAAANNNN